MYRVFGFVMFFSSFLIHGEGLEHSGPFEARRCATGIVDVVELSGLHLDASMAGAFQVLGVVSDEGLEIASIKYLAQGDTLLVDRLEKHSRYSHANLMGFLFDQVLNAHSSIYKISATLEHADYNIFETALRRGFSVQEAIYTTPMYQMLAAHGFGTLLEIDEKSSSVDLVLSRAR